MLTNEVHYDHSHLSPSLTLSLAFTHMLTDSMGPNPVSSMQRQTNGSFLPPDDFVVEGSLPVASPDNQASLNSSPSPRGVGSPTKRSSYSSSSPGESPHRIRIATVATPAAASGQYAGQAGARKLSLDVSSSGHTRATGSTGAQSRRTSDDVVFGRNFRRGSGQNNESRHNDTKYL